jgi:hypothetical protein
MAEKTSGKSQGRSRPQAQSQSKNQGRSAQQKQNPDTGRGGGGGGAKGAANGTAGRKSRGGEEQSQQKGRAREARERAGGREAEDQEESRPSGGANGGAGNVGDKLKQHPITAAALGAGLTLLAAQGLRMAISAKSPSAEDESEGQQDEGEEEEDARGAAASSEQDDADETGGDETDERDEGETGGFAGRLRQGASSLGRIGSKVGQAFRGSGEAIKRGAQSGFDRGRQGAGQGWTGHPLFLCGVAVVAGAAAGFLIPSTRQEDRLMGKQSDKVAGRFKKGSQEAFRQGRTIAGKVVSEAVNTASKEAEREGLTPDRLGKKFKRVFTNVRDAVAEAVQED